MKKPVVNMSKGTSQERSRWVIMLVRVPVTDFREWACTSIFIDLECIIGQIWITLKLLILICGVI